MAQINWKRLSVWGRLEQVPPILVRLLARNRRHMPVTTEQIASDMGVPASEVRYIDSMLTWDKLTIPTAKSYMRACGVDLDNARDVKRVRKELRRNAARPPGRRYQFARRGPESEYLMALLESYRRHLKSVISHEGS